MVNNNETTDQLEAVIGPAERQVRMVNWVACSAKRLT